MTTSGINPFWELLNIVAESETELFELDTSKDVPEVILKQLPNFINHVFH